MSGDSYERQFVRMFVATQDVDDAPSWWAQRAAASGSATDADLPDVTFAHDGVAFAGELKTTSDSQFYLKFEEVIALQNYAAAYGMRAVVIGRFKGERAYRLYNPNDMHRTGGGAYRGRPDEAVSLVIAEPDGEAEGLYPSDLTSEDVAAALRTRQVVSADG